MRTCDGQRVKEFQHYLVNDLNPPFDEVALRRGASSTMRSDRGRLLYVGFRFRFGSTVRLHIFSVASHSMSMWLSSRPMIACDKMFLLLFSLSIMSDFGSRPNDVIKLRYVSHNVPRNEIVILHHVLVGFYYHLYIN